MAIVRGVLAQRGMYSTIVAQRQGIGLKTVAYCVGITRSIDLEETGLYILDDVHARVFTSAKI
jgi:hypothetical protein